MIAAILFILLLSRPTQGASIGKDRNNAENLLDDFIIVGAGTAGCALAALLCESLPDISITLLERGLPRTPAEDYYASGMRWSFNLTENPSMAETIFSAPNPGLLEADGLTSGRKVELKTGSTLGGTSVIAGNQWKQALPGTIEDWKIPGMTTETAQAWYDRARERIGVITPPIELHHNYTPYALSALEAANFSIKEEAPYFDDDNPKLAYLNELAQDRAGRRRDSYTAYLKPAMEGPCRGRIRLLQGYTVTKLLFKDDRPVSRVKGVEYTLSNSTGKGEGESCGTLRAKNEVLLSAGPYHSAKLLQLSGIGPEKVLSKHNVTVNADLPVGIRSHARPFTSLLSLYEAPLDWANDIQRAETPESRAQFERGEGGPVGIASTNVIGHAGDAFHFEITFMMPPAVGSGFKMMASGCVPNPTSFGSVEIADADPFSQPIIHTNLLGTTEDVSRLQTCLKRMQGVQAFFPTEFNISSFQLSDPFASEAPSLDHENIRTMAESGYDFVGASAPALNLSTFHVLGFDNLRVIDTSAIPRLPVSAGPLATMYMLTEFIADKMIQEYRDDNLEKSTYSAAFRAGKSSVAGALVGGVLLALALLC